MSKQTTLSFHKTKKKKKSTKRRIKSRTATKKPNNNNNNLVNPDDFPVTAEELKAIREMELSSRYRPQVRGVVKSWKKKNDENSNIRLQEHFEQELSDIA